MKGFLLFIFIGFSILSLNLRSQPTFGWAKSFGTPKLEGCWGIYMALDANRNVYTTGHLQGKADFDPSTNGVYYLEAAYDIFISKLNAAGNFVWAKKIEGQGWHYAFDIKTDAEGNVYLSGRFIGIVDFDPGPEVYNLTGERGSNTFILKLDSSGNFLWVKSLGGGNGNCPYTSICLDGIGNIYFSQSFRDTIDVDPGPKKNILITAGDDDIVLGKLDSFGDLIWAKQIGGLSSDFSKSIVFAKGGFLYLTGGFSETCDFDTGPGVYNLISQGALDGYVSKLDTSGNLRWAKQMGGPNFHNFGFSINIDSVGNAYSAHLFWGEVDFDPGEGVCTFTSEERWDFCISKLNAEGEFVWAKHIAAYTEGPQSLKLDRKGNIYYTGTFGGTVDFDPGPKIHELTEQGGQDIFITKLDHNGNFLWTKVFGSVERDAGYALNTDDCGNIYTIGYFSDKINFNPGGVACELTSNGSWDIYVLKLEQLPVSANAVSVINDTICSGKSLILNVAGGSLGETASWKWYSDSCGGVSIGTGSSLGIIPVNTNTYFVRAENNCMITDCASLTVHVNVNPKAIFSSSLSAGCKGVSVELINQSQNADRYLWNSGNGFSSGLINVNYIFKYGSLNKISLVAINNNGCSDTVSVSQEVAKFSDYLDLRLPNIFTPNNDGVNDVYKINLKQDVSDCFSINVYNRWGQLLFNSFKPDFEWDGLYEGSKVSAGVYFYILEINKEKFEGHISLLE